MHIPKTYDPAALTALFGDAEGAAALRSRAGSIARTVVTTLALTGTPLAWCAATGGNAELAWSGCAPDIRRALVELGPTAIKFGQAAANRPDLVGSALADELRLLQEDVRTFPTAEARTAILEDGALPAERAAEILAALPAEPVAAASIGQVYKLASLGGAPGAVAVKVLRPGVRLQVAQDALVYI